MDGPAVSIIIPTLNEERYLPLLLESLRGISIPLNIIVVDGNSEDDTVGVVRRFASQFSGSSSLTLVESETRGIGLQRNRGAQMAKHDILIFLDADIIIPSPEVFETLVTEFVTNGYVTATPFLRSIETSWDLRLFHAFVSSTQKFLIRFGRPFFAGACLLTTKQVFTRIGGFDTAVVLGEDVDYGLRAATQGRCGLIDVTIPVSARRMMKYGYGWLFTEIPNMFRLFVTGRLKPETIYYPFGEYSGHKAHHVTRNTGKRKAPSSAESAV